MASYFLQPLTENKTRKNICKAISTPSYWRSCCCSLFYNCAAMSTRISSHCKLSAMSTFQEAFFSIFNEEAFQEFWNISSDFWWKNSAQGRSLSFSFRRGSFCHLSWAFLPLQLFLSHQRKWPTPQHFTLPAVLGTKSQSNLGMEKIINYCKWCF